MSGAPSPALKRAALALICLIWGTTWAAIQIGLEGTPPMTGVALRFAAAGAILLVAAWMLRVPLGRSSRERWVWISNGALSFAGSYIIVYWAEQSLPSGLTAILFATYPLFVMLLSHYWIEGDRVSRREALLITLSFLGVALIYSEDLTALAGDEARRASILMIVSPLVSAMGSVIVKRYGSDLHPLSTTAVPMLMTGGVAGLLAATLERDREVIWDATSIGALAYLTIFGTIVTFTIYFWLLRHMSVRRLALIAYLVPIVAVAVGVLRGEPMTARIGLGAALVVAGVALATRSPRPRAKRRRDP